MNKLILRTSITTVFVLFVLLGYGSAAFSLLFPRSMADFCDNLGAYDAAAMHYEREYKANPTSENLYKVLDKYIAVKNHEKIVKYAEKFFACTDYREIVTKVNNKGMFAAQDKYEYLALTNEEDRLRCNFAMSLISIGKTERAEAELGLWLALPLDTENLSQPSYAFFAFVATGKVNASVHTIFENYFYAFKQIYRNSQFLTYHQAVHGSSFLIESCRYFEDDDLADFIGDFNGL